MLSNIDDKAFSITFEVFDPLYLAVSAVASRWAIGVMFSALL